MRLGLDVAAVAQLALTGLHQVTDGKVELTGCTGGESGHARLSPGCGLSASAQAVRRVRAARASGARLTCLTSERTLHAGDGHPHLRMCFASQVPTIAHG